MAKTSASTKISEERLFDVLWATIKQHKLLINWHSVGRLIDALAQRRDCDDVIAFLCETLHASEHLTRSAFIGPCLEYIGFPAIVTLLKEKKNSDDNPTERRPTDYHRGRATRHRSNGRRDTVR